MTDWTPECSNEQLDKLAESLRQLPLVKAHYDGDELKITAGNRQIWLDRTFRITGEAGQPSGEQMSLGPEGHNSKGFGIIKARPRWDL